MRILARHDPQKALSLGHEQGAKHARAWFALAMMTIAAPGGRRWFQLGSTRGVVEQHRSSFIQLSKIEMSTPSACAKLLATPEMRAAGSQRSSLSGLILA
jgi:hypothetical protein